MYVPIFYTFREICRQRALRSGWFIVLDNLDSPNMVINLSQYIECRRGDPYMTANRYFVRFAHS